MFSRFTLQATSAISVGRRLLSTRHTGTVKWFDFKKGFGFITAADNNEIFVHQSAIRTEGFRSLSDGEQVEYDIITEANGRKKADNVTGPNGAQIIGANRSVKKNHREY
jgi:cold shock CspA family protein